MSEQGHNGSTDTQDDPKDDTASDTKQQRKTSSPFKKPIVLIVLGIAVVVLGVVGLLWWLDARKYESTDNAFVDAHLVRIAPQVAGTLAQVANIDNRHVEAGRLLAVIEPSGPAAQLEEAKANVVTAEAQAGQARAAVDAAIATRRQVADAARAPLANAIKARRDLERYEALFRLDSAAVAPQQIDAARAAARSSAAEAAAAQRQIDNADAQVEVARRAARVAGAGIAARRAAVDQANVTIGDLRLTAPIAGQVVNRQVNVGSYVAPGTQLMAIVPDRFWITANFKETQLERMRPGQHVDIKVDAFPEVKFVGHVDSIQRGAGQAFALLPPQNATGNYVKVVQRVPVRIEFDRTKDVDPAKYPLGPGMSVVPTVRVRD